MATRSGPLWKAAQRVARGEQSPPPLVGRAKREFEQLLGCAIQQQRSAKGDKRPQLSAQQLAQQRLRHM